MLQAASERSRERILLYGGPGTGKTYSWLKIADWYQKTNTPGTFFVLDTDATVDRMLDTDFGHLTNIEYAVAFDWQEYVDITAKFREAMGPGDWLVIDMLSPAWERVQEYYVDQVFSKGMEEYFLDLRKQMADTSGGGFDGWKDWSIINKQYIPWANRTMLQTRGHVLATAAATGVSRQTDATEVLDTFGKVGKKPVGQKHTGHLFHTCLLMDSTRDSWVIRTAKDRGREVLQGAEVRDFVSQYLVRVGGWKL